MEQVNIFTSLHAIYRFEVAQNLKLEEQISYGELAARCGLSSSDLRRFLRLAIAHRVFQEPDEDMIAHNALSRILIDQPVFHDWIGLICEDLHPASIYCVDAMSKWPGSSSVAHTGFSLFRGIEGGFFDDLTENPSRATRFAKSMTWNLSMPALDPSLLVDNLVCLSEPFPGSIVDVGGSHGVVGIECLRKYPQIEQYIVQDLPDIIKDAEVPAGLGGRLEFQVHNFFAKQTIKTADAILFRHVLHDWPDDRVVEILKNQVSALGRNSKIILNEVCLPKPGELTCYQERFLRSVSQIMYLLRGLIHLIHKRGLDISMKNVFNGKERDEKDWASLILQVDSRLGIRKIIKPPGSLLAIIEITLSGDTEGPYL
ncbi:MAG: hypothetical protein LQ350_005295 [Teloschistes chrysophthalmus]|nr:MAG: hypothetical protein LQ350_005295 [Niorma chrysophthalma]